MYEKEKTLTTSVPLAEIHVKAIFKALHRPHSLTQLGPQWKLQP